MSNDDSLGQLIVTEDLPTAAALLDALRPTNERWAGQSRRWIFRGHADSDWQLLPSALRRTSWRGFRPGYDPNAASRDVCEQTEWGILKEFGDRLDRAGLPIPGMTREALDHQDPCNLQPGWLRSYIELAALAQHHGVPTRLLDFTRSGLVAAYFAAQEPPEGAPPRLCVWAIDGSFFTLGHDYSPRKGGVALVRGSRAFNPNQHAQDGVLAIWDAVKEREASGLGAEPNVALDKLIQVYCIVLSSHTAEWGLPSLERQVWTEIVARLARRETFARKLMVSRSETSELCRLLANERTTAATVFPDPAGVVASMREATLHGISEHDFWAL